MSRPAEPCRVVIVGAGEIAEIAYEYLTHDSPHEVVGFSVEGEHLTREKLYGLPVVPFEALERRFDPAGHRAFVAIGDTFLNRLRARLFDLTRSKGYGFVSYVSSRAFVWHNVEIGDNCFIFENNVLQHHARIGDDTTLWSGNHIGHRSVIGRHCFISSHVVVSGFCEIGDHTFLGVNSCLAHHVKVARDCIVGAGAVLVKETEPGGVYVGNPARPLPGRSAFDSARVPAELR